MKHFDGVKGSGSETRPLAQGIPSPRPVRRAQGRLRLMFGGHFEGLSAPPPRLLFYYPDGADSAKALYTK
jgi:hypothetical protein